MKQFAHANDPCVIPKCKLRHFLCINDWKEANWILLCVQSSWNDSSKRDSQATL